MAAGLPLAAAAVAAAAAVRLGDRLGLGFRRPPRQPLWRRRHRNRQLPPPHRPPPHRLLLADPPPRRPPPRWLFVGSLWLVAFFRPLRVGHPRIALLSSTALTIRRMADFSRSMPTRAPLSVCRAAHPASACVPGGRRSRRRPVRRTVASSTECVRSPHPVRPVTRGRLKPLGEGIGRFVEFVRKCGQVRCPHRRASATRTQ